MFTKNNFISKRPFFIAELSGNHKGDINKAKKLIFFAKKNGADAVKLQTYTPEMMTLKQANFKIKKGMWAKKKLWDLYKSAHTPLSWHKELYKYADKVNIKIFSTPFSIEAVDFLEKLKTKIYKISSFEMNDLNLVKRIAETKKTVIMSTGMANLIEISESVNVLRKYGCKHLILLYCVSNYPSNYNEYNLNNISILKKKFNCTVGLSDHSIGSEIACMSIIQGAEIIEKHICLDNIHTVDSKFSLKVSDMRKFSDDIKNAFNLKKNKLYLIPKSQKDNKIFRISIYAIKNIEKGDKFSSENIKTFRPNLGLSASNFIKIIGKKSPQNIKKNSVLKKTLMKKLNIN